MQQSFQWMGHATERRGIPQHNVAVPRRQWAQTRWVRVCVCVCACERGCVRVYVRVWKRIAKRNTHTHDFAILSESDGTENSCAHTQCVCTLVYHKKSAFRKTKYKILFFPPFCHTTVSTRKLIKMSSHCKMLNRTGGNRKNVRCNFLSKTL